MIWTVVSLLAHVTVNLTGDVPGQIEKRHIFVLALAEVVIGQNRDARARDVVPDLH